LYRHWKAFTSNQKAVEACSTALEAGADGSRTHRGPQRDPPPVLKTGEPTGAQPPPFINIPFTPARVNELHLFRLHNNRSADRDQLFRHGNHIYWGWIFGSPGNGGIENKKAAFLAASSF